ncbi:MAG: translesion error-prone DNA polymerase V autoproteolytic subunit [Bacteroidales bacterium]|nr:translesion error-prone DNA polymerase V autoproteolytic subunit [Bacteroidales bacterium]
MAEKESVELFESIHAGFPSPAEDIPGKSLDIKDLLIKNPASTFFARVQGESMSGDGISDGDIIVIDKSEQARDGSIAVCYVDGEFTVKRLEFHKDYILLKPSNAKYSPIKVTADNNLIVWGIVKFVIKKF